jgi:hypothetical protein
VSGFEDLPPLPPPGRRPSRGRRGPGAPPTGRGLRLRVVAALLFLLGVLALRHVVSGGGAEVFKSLTGATKTNPGPPGTSP